VTSRAKGIPEEPPRGRYTSAGVSPDDEKQLNSIEGLQAALEQKSEIKSRIK
jgi:hypothetical protein